MVSNNLFTIVWDRLFNSFLTFKHTREVACVLVLAYILVNYVNHTQQPCAQLGASFQTRGN